MCTHERELTMNTEPTATPWTEAGATIYAGDVPVAQAFSEYFRDTCYEDGPANMPETPQEAWANAERIVQAVNAYAGMREENERLKEALERLLAREMDTPIAGHGGGPMRDEEVIEIIRAALTDKETTR